MLMDGFGRKVDYLRLSVTDRCDLRCAYCMPAGFKGYEEPGRWLSFEEIERLVSVFSRMGLRRIRLTGGEPLLRKNLPVLADRLSKLPGVEDLTVSTNGTRLAKYAAALRQAGVTRLNVSLDSLDRQRVEAICGRDVLPRILAGLDAAKAQNYLAIKINMVAAAGVTDADIEAMVAYCSEHGYVLRLIETMPMGEAGKSAGYTDLRPIMERLRARFGLMDGVIPGGGPARYLVSSDRRFQIGFISPISQHFCETCNRVRLAVDGKLHLCLGHDVAVDFRELLRSGAGDSEIEDQFRAALLAKPARHEFVARPDRTIRIMSSIGG